MCAVCSCLLCFGETISDFLFFCLAIHDGRRCAFSYQSDIFLILLIEVINPIPLERLGAEGKYEFPDQHVKECVCVYICVCVYMYIHVCIKRRKSHGVRGAQVQGRCDCLLLCSLLGPPFFPLPSLFLFYFIYLLK